MKNFNNKIFANVIRKAWRNAPEGKAKDAMLKYADKLSQRG